MYHFDICVPLAFFSNSLINYILEQELPTDGTMIFSTPHTHSSATFISFLTLEWAKGALKVGTITWDISFSTIPSWLHWHGLAESSFFAWHPLSRSLNFHTVSMFFSPMEVFLTHTSACLYACPLETIASVRCCSNVRPSKRGRSWVHSADAVATISLWAAKPHGSQEFLSKPLKTAWGGFRFRQRWVSLSGRIQVWNLKSYDATYVDGSCS